MLIWTSLESLLLFLLLLQKFAMATSSVSKCVRKTEVEAVFGETVYFHICDEPQLGIFPTDDQVNIIVWPGLKQNQLKHDIRIGTTVNGWSWNAAGTEPHIYFNISLTPSSPDDFTIYRVQYGKRIRGSAGTDGVIELDKLTLLHRGPPELCWKGNKKPPKMSHPLLSTLGSDSKSTLCFVSQNPVKPTIVWHAPCIDSTSPLLAPTFNVSVEQDPEKPSVHQLVYKVTNMSAGDPGMWKIYISNCNGTLPVQVEVNDTNAPACSRYADPDTTNGSPDAIVCNRNVLPTSTNAKTTTTTATTNASTESIKGGGHESATAVCVCLAMTALMRMHSLST